MNTLETIAIGVSLGLLAAITGHADDTTRRTEPVKPVVENSDIADPTPWLNAADGELTFLDPHRDPDKVAVLKQFKRNLDPDKHGKIYGDQLRVTLYRMKNTLPELHDELNQQREMQEGNRLAY